MSKNIIVVLAFITLLFTQDYTYSLEDINPNSETYQKLISPSYFNNSITISYFGHQY